MTSRVPGGTRSSSRAVPPARSTTAIRSASRASACPPEDVGGPAGYADFLRVIADPNDPRHLEMRQRLGRPFHPEAFDPEEATQGMSALRSTLSFGRTGGAEGRPSTLPLLP